MDSGRIIISLVPSFLIYNYFTKLYRYRYMLYMFPTLTTAMPPLSSPSQPLPMAITTLSRPPTLPRHSNSPSQFTLPRSLNPPTPDLSIHPPPASGLQAKDVARLESLIGVQDAVDVEDLNIDLEEWDHVPEADQIVIIEPIATSGTVSKKKDAPKDGVRKRGRKPGPPKFNVRFLPPLTPTTGV